jgi:hypothetical protein
LSPLVIVLKKNGKLRICVYVLLLKPNHTRLTNGILHKMALDGVLQQCLFVEEAYKVLVELHEGATRGHYCRNPTLAKCRGESQHSQSWGLGLLRDSRMFKVRQQGPKHLASRSDLEVGSYERPKSQDSTRDSFGTISGLQFGSPGKKSHLDVVPKMWRR